MSVVEAVALARAGREEEVVLTARPSGRRSAGSFEVTDATGTLAAALDRPELAREGATIELRGFPATRRGEPVLADARWRSGGPSSFDVSRRDAGLALLTKVSQVRALSRSEAERGHPVRLDAVATYVSGAFRQLFVQDETGGLYVAIERRDAGIAVGDRVRVEGFTAPGGLAPVVVDPELRRLGPGRLPPAPRASAARLAAGHEDCRRVEVEGLVRGAIRGEADSGFLLAVEGQRIPVHLPPEWRDVPLPPVDARVRVRGVGGSHFNWRSQFDRAELFVPAPGDVEIEEAPPDPLLLPLVPVRDVLRTGSSGRWQRLARTRGVVLRHREGQPLYLRDASGTLVVDSDGIEPLVPGDEVEVLGFPASGPAPEPTVLAGNRLGHALEADLARLPARLIEVVPHEGGVTLLLQAADGVVEAHGDGELDPAPPRGSLLEVTGVLLPHDHGDGGAPGLRVLLRSLAKLS